MAIYLLGAVGLLAIAGFVIVGFRLKRSQLRLSRSLDPIAQKSKTLKIELSALKHSRLDRQRRLETSNQITDK